MGLIMILKVSDEENGLCLSDFLQKKVPAAPQSYLRQLVKKGKVIRNDEPIGWQDRLVVGDKIHLPQSERLRELYETVAPVCTPLRVLYESREILIVEKPAGLAVHSSEGHERLNLTARVEELLAERGDRFQVAPIHRLDVETSGPVIFGKGKKSCAELGKMFMRHEVDKYYLALVVGQAPGQGLLKSSVPAKGKIKEAVTEYRALSRQADVSLLELRLGTGRQHQIRRQLAEAGHPIFGDRRYGGPCPSNLPRMFLHSCRLSFIDPFSGAQLDIESALPEELSRFYETVLTHS